VAENVENAMLEILKKIQEEGAATRRELAAFREEANSRFGALETAVRKQRRDIAGILVIGKALAGHLDERVTYVERRVTRLETGAR
jgi:hypothetical protein